MTPRGAMRLRFRLRHMRLGFITSRKAPANPLPTRTNSLTINFVTTTQIFSMPGLQYSTLKEGRKEIRLLTILPRGPNAPNTAQNNNRLISCTLTVVSLNNPPPYTALSYVWGDARYKKRVLVNESVVEITVNLEDALRHFEQELELVIIWVDALCMSLVRP